MPRAVQLAVLAIALVFAVTHARGQVRPAPELLPISAQEQAAGLTFAPGSSATDIGYVRDAIAKARPEAQRLIRMIDGLVTVRFGALPPNVAGRAEGRGNQYTVTIAPDLAFGYDGLRAVRHVVLHELAHIVDFALVKDEIRNRMDVAIPQCAGDVPNCGDPEERFADTFSKWATYDVGVRLPVGYRIPAPADLNAWSVPLLIVKAPS